MPQSSYYSPDESDEPIHGILDSLTLDSGDHSVATLSFETAKLELNSGSSSSQSEGEEDEEETDVAGGGDNRPRRRRKQDVTPTQESFHTPLGKSPVQRTSRGGAETDGGLGSASEVHVGQIISFNFAISAFQWSP